MPAFVLRLSRLEQSASFGQFWGISDCVTCYGFGGGLCYVLRLWAVSVLRVTAFGGSCVTQCYVLQLFGSVTLDGVDVLAVHLQVHLALAAAFLDPRRRPPPCRTW